MDKVFTFTLLTIMLIVVRLETPIDIHPPQLVWWAWVFAQYFTGAGLGISVYRLVKRD